MAKKIQIDIEVNGKMQKATVSAKKLRDALSGVDEASTRVGKSARETDRNIKGTANASSNAAKNFSKMQQGMGGLVGAYASLAASLFAVSAAFNFLKSAGELKSLQAGQVAYASATGVALGTLTQDIIEATNAQIQFRDAAQAAAIGTAAGLNADQLTRLGKAAADASQILGRDVTDSFNRLVRGATKAEPELLDELGIILRLEKASKDYAQALGLNANELTTFQKQQAVTTDIIRQAEEKYGDILDIVGRSPNQYAQLGKAFDDIIMKVKEVVDAIAGPLAKVLQDTPALAIASLGVLLSGPLRALGFSFAGIADAAQDAAEKQRVFYQGVREDAKLAQKSAKDFKNDLRGLSAAGMAMGANAGFLTKFSEGKDLSGADAARFKSAVAAAENNVNRLGIVTKGAFTGMKIHMVREMDEAFMNMNVEIDKTLTKMQIFQLRAKAGFAGIAAVAKGAAAGIATAFSTALSLVSYAALAFTGYQMYKEFTAKPPTDEEAKLAKEAEAADDLRRKLQSVNKEMSLFAEIQSKTTGSGSLKFYENMANFFSATTSEDMAEMTKQLKELGIAQQQVGETARESTIKNASMFGGIAAGVLTVASVLKTAAKALPGGSPQTLLGKGLLYGGGTLLAGIGGGLGGAGASSAAEAAREAGVLDATTAAALKENELRKAMKARLEMMKDVIEKAKETSNISFPGVDALLTTINQILATGGPISDDQIQKFQQAFTSAQGVTSELFAAAQAAAQLSERMGSFVAQLTEISTGESILSELTTRIEQLTATRDEIVAEGGDSSQVSSELARLKVQRFALTEIVELEHNMEKRILQVQEDRIRLMGDETAAQKEQIKFANDAAQLEAERLNLIDQINVKRAAMTLGAAEKRISTAEFAATAEGQALQDAIDLLAIKLRTVINDIQANTAQSEAAGDLTTAKEANKSRSQELDIANKIVQEAKKRLDLEKQILDFAKKRDERNIDKAMVEERLKNPFYYINEDQRRARMELDAFNKRYDAEKDLIKRRGEVAKQAIQSEYQLLNHRLNVSLQEAQATGSYTSTMGANASNLRTEMRKTEGMAVKASEAATKDELEQLEHKKFMLEAQIQLTNKLQEAVEDAAMSMEENFTNAFAAIIDGSSSGKDAFRALAESMIQDISRIVAKLLVQQAIMASMNMLSGLFGPTPAAAASPTAKAGALSSAGIDDMINSIAGSGRYGGILKGYSAGGIARGSDAGHLAMLHGTEAVVPLPNGRSIPVEMSGAGAQTNNVSVSVNINNDGSAETTTEDDAKGMGKAIAAAVQREIQHQKRPGGMLSPYGGTR